jgi:hypothetical protein
MMARDGGAPIFFSHPDNQTKNEQDWSTAFVFA